MEDNDNSFVAVQDQQGNKYVKCNAHLFASHFLNDDGLAKAKQIGQAFMNLIDAIDPHMMDGRLRSIVHTKLEEACFFAKKSMAVDLQNQKT